MKRGFTLVELILSMAILAMMVVIAIGTINPLALMGRANDARRKKDIARIKVAFEEYINDTGCYPSQVVIDGLGCNSSGFSQWGINSWPCDPVARTAYKFFVEQKNCPSWYKILTNLSNKKDPQIPVGWYNIPNPGYSLDGNLAIDQANFGVSSPNVLWYLGQSCFGGVQGCYQVGGDGNWYTLPRDVPNCNAYVSPDFSCLVSCCFNGAVCQNSSICP